MRFLATFFLSSFLFACSQAHAQTLVYELTYSDTRASYQARFASVSPMPGRRSEDENIAMMRNSSKNELYTFSLAAGKPNLIFSDEGSHLELITAATDPHSGAVYSFAVWRERRTTPTPGFYSDDGVYELSLDGSNHSRKIAAAQNRAHPEINPQGTRAVVQSSGADSLTLYSLPEWSALATLDISKLSHGHCPGCSLTSFGWLADGNRLFVSLDVVGEEDDASAKLDHPGTYILSADGADLGPIASETAPFQYAGYSHANDVDRHPLGQLPDGRYAFIDYGFKQGDSRAKLEPFLVISGGASEAPKVFALKFPATGPISPDGKYLASIESRQTPDYRSELHLWVKDLETGEEKELASTPPPNRPDSPQPNVTIKIVGWLNK